MPPEGSACPNGGLAGPDPAGPYLVMNLDTSSISVRRALAEVSDGLGRLSLTRDATGMIELIVAEVLNNICEHAYRTGRGHIELSVWVQGDMLAFRTRDRGRPMPNGRLPEGARATLDCAMDQVPEGGFGWYLIRQFAADLNYERVAGENLLTFRMRRDAQPVV